ncbi:MAG: hypothetical protein LLF76_11775 [Planctomycetaceae bacterium]|nr:hypothetical protein [Planctomycetaceae bacterium]
MQSLENGTTALVRQRMIEFLGGPNLKQATCVHLSNSRGAKDPACIIRPVRQLDYFIAYERDFSRSLHDRESLLIDLDMEYANFDFPAEPYLDRPRALGLQKSVFEIIRSILGEYGIDPLCLITGRGYHFIWRIKKSSRVYGRLVRFGRISRALKRRYCTLTPPVEIALGRAFAGAGMMMEYLMQQVKRTEGGRNTIPVEILEVLTTPQQRGKEIISLDISEYSDPLDTRFVRVPFSIYLKPYWKPGVITPQTQDHIPFIVVLPVWGDPDAMLAKSQDLAAIPAAASQASASIPEMSAGTERLVDAYEHSALYRFHQYFYEQEHEQVEDWPTTYDRTPLDFLPPCVRFMLEHPNDLLLSPAAIRLLTAVLLATRWHPRHIAGLIRSKYERDHGWLNEWYVYDAGSRADFYVRVFAGCIHTKLDRLKDLNCESLKNSGLCPDTHAHCGVEAFAEVLLQKELFV